MLLDCDPFQFNELVEFNLFIDDDGGGFFGGINDPLRIAFEAFICGVDNLRSNSFDMEEKSEIYFYGFIMIFTFFHDWGR